MSRPKALITGITGQDGSYLEANGRGRKFILVDQNPESMEVVKDRLPIGSFHLVS
jgi:hypothetical protein